PLIAYSNMFPLVQSGCSVNRDLTVGSVVTADAAELGPMTVVPSGNLIRYTVPVWFPAGAMYRPAKFWEGLWYISTSLTAAQVRFPLIGVMMNRVSSVDWR